MMSPSALFVIGVVTVLLLAVFVFVTLHEVRTSPPGVKPLRGLLPIAGPPSPIERTTPRAFRVLLAVDGSPCSDRAVQSVAARPWPAGSEIEVLSVVHTRVPAMPGPDLMIEAAHVEALEADRQRAPMRAERAERFLTSTPGLQVTSRVLEGDTSEVILDEAERWDADLIVLGSHGYGAAKRRLLGSVSQAVASHARCSVEIVRCPHADLTDAASRPAS
jgi:nucleotide-binding universal stress UspA family protein